MPIGIPYRGSVGAVVYINVEGLLGMPGVARWVGGRQFCLLTPGAKYRDPYRGSPTETPLQGSPIGIPYRDSEIGEPKA